MQNLTENTLPKNLFLREEEQELQKLAYYGKFLVLSEFDDGWKYQMERQLLDYLVSLEVWELESKINLQVEREIDKEKWEIFAILKSQSLNPETEEKILEISTKLQKRFFMTPVNQKVGFGSSEDNSFKVELENLKSDDLWYERIEFQKIYVDILNLEDELESKTNQINLYKNIDDEITKALVDVLIRAKHDIESEIIVLQEELNNLLPELYKVLTLKKDNTPTSELSSFQADWIVQMSDKNYKSNDLWILDLLKKMEKIYDSNLEQNDRFYKKIEELLNIKWIETTKVTKWLLTNFETDEWYLTKAKILDAKNSNIYVHDGLVHDFNIEGLGEEINKIKIIEQKNWIVTFFIAELLNWNKILYKSLWNKYIPLEIDTNKEFKDFTIQLSGWNNNSDYYRWWIWTQIDWSKFYYYIYNWKFEILEIEWEIYFNRFNNISFLDNWTIKSWEIIVDDNKRNYFYLENWIYKYLEIKNQKDFKNFSNMNYEWGKLSYWEVVLINNKRNHFYKDGLEFRLLDINNWEKYKSYQDLKFNEEWIPISYIVELENWKFSIYQLKWKIYSPLKLEWKTEFSNYREFKYNNGIIKNWIVANWDWSKYFYLEDWEYKILEVEWKTIFTNFDHFIHNKEPFLIPQLLILVLYYTNN